MSGESKTKPVTRVWLRIEEVEISWLPVGECAFLLWVLALLLVLWFGICAALGLL